MPHTKKIASLALILFLSLTLVHAQNDPGHDTLYILRTGDSISGDYNFSNVLFVNETTGRIGIGTSTPAAKLQMQDGAILANGTTGATPTSGAGTRLMWIPSKAAFRAGYVDGTQWDDSQIGTYSTALGYKTKANGTQGATATGSLTTASGNTGATATGDNTIASGDNGATALGSITIANGNYGATATGRKTTASGNYGATALGYYTTASGTTSTAIGQQINVSGTNSIGIGLQGGSYPYAPNFNLTQNNTMAIMGGNVGINTTSPGEILEVSGNINATNGDICITGGNCLSNMGTGSGDINSVGSMTSGAAFADSSADDDWLGLGASAGRIEFDNQATDEVNILDANVGINTQTPTSKLHVNGSVEINDNFTISPPRQENVGTGTITASGSNFIFGTGTSFLTELVPEEEIILDTGRYEIVIVYSDDFAQVNSSLSVSSVSFNYTIAPAEFRYVDGAILVNGGKGDTPTSGAGTRMMWIPSKGAFRAGRVTGNHWDDSNISDYSFAAGYNTIANGFVSTALGYEALASSSYTTALGYQTTASGQGSTALGYQTTASGNYSTAAGQSTKANGTDGATALGKGSTASGNDGATAIGYYTLASGRGSTALGYQTKATREGSTALGNYTLASGQGSTASGTGTTASGQGSTASGDNTTASGDFGATASGTGTTASGQYGATASGYQTTASGNTGATALGYQTTASGNDGATAIGYQTTASGKGSTALGYQTTASGATSLAIGQEIEAGGAYSLAIALNDQNGANVSQSNTMAIMGGNVGINTATPSQALEINGGLRLNTSTSKPSCSSSVRGTFWFEQASSGNNDLIYSCMKNSSDSYNWVQVAIGG